jgi:hypothetical protein
MCDQLARCSQRGSSLNEVSYNATLLQELQVTALLRQVPIFAGQS